MEQPYRYQFSQSQAWTPLRVLNLYRLLLAGVACILSVSGLLPSPVGNINPNLFYYVSLVYFSFAFVNLFITHLRRPRFQTQVQTQIFVDILAISIWLFCSGGVTSGVGILYIIAIAGGSILLEGRMSIFFAAIATFSLFTQQIYAISSNFALDSSYPHTGLLGASFFATAILSHVLAKRLRDSEQLAEQRRVDIANLSQLNDYVIERMQTGIVVIDQQDQVILINASAKSLLDRPSILPGTTLSDLSEQLTADLHQWKNDHVFNASVIKAGPSSPEVQPKFAQLGQNDQTGTLVFLEDITATAQHAQQIKLVSLGQLTASIAHEIRNPLGAISHASQLLCESPALQQADIRLTEIIQDHSKRVNTIIENVMQLNKRDKTYPQMFSLRPWLETFKKDFCLSENINSKNVVIKFSSQEIEINIDPSQLQQILWNLCSNAMRHSRLNDNEKIFLKAKISKDPFNAYLDVVDQGKGITESEVSFLFEPFYTTQASGTGLGLYIAKELCECNQSRLDYVSENKSGACFRITFSDSRRRHHVTA